MLHVDAPYPAAAAVPAAAAIAPFAAAIAPVAAAIAPVAAAAELLRCHEASLGMPRNLWSLGFSCCDCLLAPC